MDVVLKCKEQMEMEKQYVVLAAADIQSLENKGADVEDTYCETAVEARRRARYLLTEEYRLASESSSLLGYSRVLLNGVCVADYFGK